MEKKKVVIGMSGGVDSSVGAWLLKEQGYDVIGATMVHWEPEGCHIGEVLDQMAKEQYGGPDGDTGNGILKSGMVPAFAADARRMADALGIPHYILDFRREFREHVMKQFAEEYLRGRTPNPCVICNRFVKWEALLARSRALGAEYIATGHYARIKILPNGRYTLQVTGQKDQTYALYRLTQEQLSHTLMPVGLYQKSEIRNMAKQAGLEAADTPDSQEICFIPDHDYAKFIREFTGKVPPEGNFVTKDGRILGRHQGITNYTVGQRRGLNIAEGRRIFVTEIRPQTNEVVIGEAEDVFSDRLVCDEVNWMAVDGLHGREMRVSAKIRYAHKAAPCVIREREDGSVECVFDEPQRAITPGQAVVFYQDDYVVGGGTIR
ncbi:MAG: tRNA 2-thiouridine(34) synthase MnmA [bacterium]|nr:tRNA 2-thiouridine(34) synthase MnmA [bacterium]